MRLVIVENAGDYAEAFEGLAKGGSETYYAQKYCVDAVTEIAKRAESVTVMCCMGPELNEQVLENRVRAIACGLSQGERILLNTVHQWSVYFEINSPFLEATDTLCNDFCPKIETD